MKGSNRRTFLKTTTSSLVGLGLGTATTGVQARDGELITEPQKEWEFTNESTNAAGNTAYHSVALTWYNGQWYDSRGWVHDMALTGVVACRSGSGNPVKNITKNRYYMQVADEQDQRLDPDRGDDFHGVYPSGSSSGLPVWVEIPASTAIGALSAPVSFALGAKNLVEAMEPEDGYNIYDYGYGFEKNIGTWKMGWTDASHFQRFMFESTSDGTIGRDFWIDSIFENTDSTSEITIDIDVWKDDQPNPSANTASSSDTMTTSNQEMSFNPREMSKEQREKYGIKKVTKSASTNTTGTEEQSLRERTPEFIATNIPITAKLSSQ